jgi:hypothetical protein
VLAALTAVLLIWFTGLFVLRGFRFPVGPDAPVYLWWTRLAGVEGLSTVERPGATALLGVLRWTGVGLPAAVAGAECALGVAVGLGSAALARAGGASRVGWGLAGALAGTFATHLAAGYVSNLVFAVVFIGAVTVLDGPSRRAVLAAAILLGAGGLAHPLFFLVGVVVLVVAGAIALHDGVRGEAWRGVAASAGGGAILAAGWLSMLAGPAVPAGDTSQDAFLRRAGLGDTLAHAYRDRLIHRWTRYVQWASLPLATLGAARPRGWVRRALWGWAAVTIAGVFVGAAAGWFPPDRLITFGYAIPILAAFGLVWLVERWPRRRALAIAVAAALAAAMVAGAGIAWLREKPYLGTTAVDAVVTASRYAAATPRGTPWVFPVDSPSSRISFLATRARNVIRAAVPPDRIADVYVIAPPPPAGLSSGDEREWSELARLYAAEATTAALGAPPPIVIDVAAFDDRDDRRRPLCGSPTGGSGTAQSPVCEALNAPMVRVADGVSLSALSSAATGAAPLAPRDAALDSSTARIAVAAPLVLAILGAAGLGWSLLLTRDPIRALGLSPAFGTTAILLGGVIADRIGLRLDGAGAGLLVLALVTAAGYLPLVVGEWRRRARSAP